MGKIVERLLDKQRNKISNLKAPLEMEELIHNKLFERKMSNNNGRFQMKKLFVLSSILIILIIISYSGQALAYYGKQLVGYSEITSPNLQQYLDDGIGQILDEELIIKNEDSLTIDGVVIRDNTLLIFSRIETNSAFTREEFDDHSWEVSYELQGLFNKSYEQSSSVIHYKDHGQLIMIHQFELPNFYETYLKLNYHVQLNGYTVSDHVRFKLDRDEAQIESYEKAVNKTLKIDDQTINIDQLSISKYNLEIKNKVSSDVDKSGENRNTSRFVSYDLLINNQKVIKSDPLDGIINHDGSSTLSYDILNEIKAANIVNIKLGTIYFLNKDLLELHEQINDTVIIKDQLIIRDIKKEDNTVITVASKGIPTMQFLNKSKEVVPTIEQKLIDQEGDYKIYEITIEEQENTFFLGMKYIAVTEHEEVTDIKLLEQK